jgi:hypothetical protein
MRLLLAAALLLVYRPALAAVDWQKGLLVARGAAAADLRAPSPDIARVAAERAARGDLEKRLRAALRGLPIAGGGTVGGRADKDARAKAALDEIVEGTLPERTLHSDGSVTVQVTVPLRRVVESVLGAAAETEERATLLLVDARKVKARPALGWRVRAGDVTRAAPTYFAGEAPAEAGAGEALRARATAARDGVLVVDLPGAKLADARGLWVVVVTGGAH